MSKSKNKRKTQAKRAASRPTKQPRSKSADVSKLDGEVASKKPLTPATIAMIVVPLVAILGVVAWFSIGGSSGGGSGDPDETSGHANVVKRSGSDPAEGSTTRAAANAKRIWDDQTIGDAWTTDSDRKQLWNQIDNPAADGWESEVLAGRVTDQFVKLKKLIVSNKTIDGSAVKKLVAEDLQVQSLLPTDIKTAFQDGQLHVRRGVFDAGQQPASIDRADSPSGFSGALNEMLEPFQDREKLKVKLKVFRVEQGEVLTTHQTLELFGQTETGVREENAVWVATWTDDKKPRLKSIQITQYESVDLKDGPMFVDCTEYLLGQTTSFQKQLRRSYDDWLEGSQVNSPFVLLGNNGIAIGDVNADGLEDIYICQEAALPNLLYIQNADGTLRDASKESGTDWLQNSTAALIVDFNNDGNQDLAVAFTGGVVIAQGDGQGNFQQRTIVDSSDHIWSLTAADYDRDGWLDLFVGAHSADGATNVAANVVLTDSAKYSSGGKNNLFKNEALEGGFVFREVTDECGLLENNFRYTFATSWEDIDNDGDLDLYVANDFGWNNLYRNDLQPDGSVKFFDIADAANAKDDAFGMSIAWGDYDRDGWMDIYVSNMFSYAGNRITYQNQFKTDTDREIKERFQRYARGNTLLRNAGKAVNGSAPESAQTGLEFEDHSLQAGVNMGRWAWGSCFIDFNNDGWEDLFATNGYITSGDNGDL